MMADDSRAMEETPNEPLEYVKEEPPSASYDHEEVHPVPMPISDIPAEDIIPEESDADG